MTTQTTPLTAAQAIEALEQIIAKPVFLLRSAAQQLAGEKHGFQI